MSLKVDGNVDLAKAKPQNVFMSMLANC
jgi:hypothetical protein